MFIPYDERQELYHHGILGMHWGIRRYQPYPQGAKKGKEVGAATRVKQRPKKRKLSKDAKMRAKMRNEIKNTELRAKLETAKAAEATAKKSASVAGATDERVSKKVSKAERKMQKLQAKQTMYEAKASERRARATMKQQKQAAQEASLNARANKYEMGRRTTNPFNPFRTEYGKQRAISSGDPKRVKRYAKYMTNEEYKRAIDRCDAAMGYRMKQVGRLVEAGQKLANNMKTIGDIAGNAMTMHDNIVDVRNGMKLAKAKKMGHDISDKKVIESLNLGTKWKQTPVNYENQQKQIRAAKMREEFIEKYNFDPLSAGSRKAYYTKKEKKAAQELIKAMDTPIGNTSSWLNEGKKSDWTQTDTDKIKTTEQKLYTSPEKDYSPSGYVDFSDVFQTQKVKKKKRRFGRR